MTIETIPSFIVLLGILVSVHELGHFTVAKMLGFKVLKEGWMLYIGGF